MERVYLVLRNNQQSGPFTIGELLQQQLRPSDMIWIEGKSTAWTYLSELDLVHHSTDSIQSPPPQAKDEIERKAEELRQRILAAAPKYYTPKAVEVESFASSYSIPEKEIEFIDHRKQKNSQNNVVYGEFALTVLVIGLFALGIYKGKSFLAERKEAPNSVASQLISRDQHAAEKKPVNVSVSFPVADTLQRDSSLVVKRTNFIKSTHSKTTADSTINTLATNNTANNQTTSMQARKSEEQISVPPVTKNSEEIKKEEFKKVTVSEEPKEKKIISEPEEKKKGFLGGLFKKKKKDSKSNDE